MVILRSGRRYRGKMRKRYKVSGYSCEEVLGNGVIQERGTRYDAIRMKGYMVMRYFYELVRQKGV